MKLYTEEQVRQMIDKSQATGLNADYLLLATKPIELPSDEEVMQEIQFDEFDPEDRIYLAGINWMRDKIQGGNK